MKNFIQPGLSVQLTAPAGGVVGGMGYLIGGAFGVAGTSAAAGALVEFRIDGVIDLPKAAGAAWTEGLLLYWDNAAKNVTATATGNTKIGVACRVGGETAAATIGRVRLNGAF